MGEPFPEVAVGEEVELSTDDRDLMNVWRSDIHREKLAVNHFRDLANVWRSDIRREKLAVNHFRDLTNV